MQVWRRQWSCGRPGTSKAECPAIVRRPNTGKADTLTCGRMPHRKDDGRGGGVRRHANPRDGVQGIHPSSRSPTPSRADHGRTRAQGPEPAGPVEKQIDVIFDGSASGGNSSSAQKAYARSEVGKRPLHHEDLDVTFRSGGEEHSSHDDALVISICMANAYVKRVMIDTGSSTDILYFDAFQRLGLTDRDIAPLTSTLTGFTGDSVSPLGTTTIPVTFGGEPKSKTMMVSFMVVKLPSAYNAIIGHPTLNRLKAIISTYHRILKFSTRAGVGEVRSDPREFR
ncbi:hypothetical protein B296_00031832 [Ensete ventricosum]|uniref:Peptidase A2 domain-containing protein n=1 Tax=Ensete ventricosum TaxID=4639 RepID=A0A426Y1Z1_ENSVE|nr:hypothetical protein B296_00031832 [Ensete ventricosum]